MDVGKFFRRPWYPWLLLAAVSAAILVPIAAVGVEAFNEAPAGGGFTFGFGVWADTWSDPRILRSLGNTFALVAVRTVLGLGLAIALAWLVARTNLPGSGWLEFCFWISFFLPTLAAIQGWTLLFAGQTGLVNQWIEGLGLADPSPIDINSFWGIVWVHLTSNIGGFFILLVLAFRNMDSSLEEASRVGGASRMQTLTGITLPLMRPAIAMVVVVAIIRGMQSFEVERVLGPPAGISVYATLVVEMLSDEPSRYANATALSTFVLLLLIPLILIQRRYVGSRLYTTVTSRMRPEKIDLGRLRWVAFAFVLVVALLSTLVPGAALVAGSFMTRWGFFSIPQPWTSRNWESVLSDGTFTASLVNSIQLGVASAIVATVVVFVVAVVLVRTDFRGRPLLDFVSWLPWAVPGVLLSLGILAAVLGIPVLRFLHGSLALLIVAVVLFRFPLGVHLIRTGLLQLGRELEEASYVAGARWWYTQLRISVAILMPMLVAVALIVLITALNEVSGVVLLASTDTRTLSLLSLDYLLGSPSDREGAAVVIVIVSLLAIVIALVARLFGLRLGGGGLT